MYCKTNNIHPEKSRITIIIESKCLMLGKGTGISNLNSDSIHEGQRTIQLSCGTIYKCEDTIIQL